MKILHWLADLFCNLIAGALVLVALTDTASAFAVNAGPNQTIPLPAQDLTLFGSTTANPTQRILWTVATGPGPVAFSANDALVTTASFSTAGTYVLQLTVDDGTGPVSSSLTATVLTAASQSAFYVDPDYTGSTRTGTSSQPWRSLSDTVSNTPWTVINNALAFNNVIVYFSARKAGSDTAQTSSVAVNLNRSDPSTTRLTLDGMSKYNTNASTPSWIDYAGTSRFSISANYPFSTNNDSSPYPHRNYITIRGFKTTGQGGAHLFFANMSDFVYEHNEHTASSVPGTGPGVIVAHRPLSDPDSTAYGRRITIRANYVHNTRGEGIYIGGSTPDPPGHGSIQTNVDVLIENNTITDPGSAGDQGDGIDVKDGNVNLVIRGNVIRYTSFIDSQNHGIVVESAALIESNYVEAAPWHGIRLAPAWNNSYGRTGTIIRNNVIVQTKGHTGMVLSGSAIPSLTYQDACVYNNTILMVTDYVGSPNALSVGGFVNFSLRNNIFAAKNNNIDILVDTEGTTYAIHSNNLFWRNGLANVLVYDGVTYYSSPTLRNWEATAVYGDPALVSASSPFDLELLASSPAIGVGANLSTTGFASDYVGSARPQSSAWDIGAYAFVTPLPPPTNLQVR